MRFKRSLPSNKYEALKDKSSLSHQSDTMHPTNAPHVNQPLKNCLTFSLEICTFVVSISSGGFAVRGYRVQAQAGGHGDFKDVITDTQDGNTDCVVTRLTCTTWYEFRVAALNVHGTGAWSEASEPVLTPAAGSNASGKPGQRRQRRSMQTGGPKAAAARAQVEEARMQLMAYAEQLALSERTVQQWEDDWRVQPRAEGVVFVSATAHCPGLLGRTL